MATLVDRITTRFTLSAVPAINTGTVRKLKDMTASFWVGPPSFPNGLLMVRMLFVT